MRDAVVVARCSPTLKMNDALARIFNIYLRTKRRTKAKRWWSKYLGMLARAPQLPAARFLFIQGKETRAAAQVEKEHKNGCCWIFFFRMRKESLLCHSDQIILNFLLFGGWERNCGWCIEEKGVSAAVSFEIKVSSRNSPDAYTNFTSEGKWKLPLAFILIGYCKVCGNWDLVELLVWIKMWLFYDYVSWGLMIKNM